MFQAQYIYQSDLQDLFLSCFFFFFFLQLKKDIDLEKAGLQFIPYQELQVTVSETSEPASDAAAADRDEDIEMTQEEGKLVQQENLGGDEGTEKEETSHLVENIKISDPRRGTEVKLLGLMLGENTATVVAPQITVSLQCNR